MYGNMNLSKINEMPANREKIKTVAIKSSEVSKV
jgi:RecG-like helicase